MMLLTRVLTVVASSSGFVVMFIVHGPKALFGLLAIPILYGLSALIGPKLFSVRPTIAELEAGGAPPSRARIAAYSSETIATVTLGGSLASLYWVFASLPSLQNAWLRGFIDVLIATGVTTLYAVLVILFSAAQVRKERSTPA
ncbi:MAG: hypothetical protein WB491_05730 [Candidatus Aquilonibacter sp.]